MDTSDKETKLTVDAPLVSGASADKGANASSDSDSSSSSDSDSEDDDTQFAIEGLTPEQQAIVNARVRQLQSNYNSFIERQREQKLTDLMENLGILQREAEVALEFCSGNEMEALTRWSSSPEFVTAVRDFIDAEANGGSKPKPARRAPMTEEERAAYYERIRNRKSSKKSKATATGERCSRLLLDDALRLLEAEGVLSGVSPSVRARLALPSPSSLGDAAAATSSSPVTSADDAVDAASDASPKSTSGKRARKAPKRSRAPQHEFEDDFEDAPASSSPRAVSMYPPGTGRERLKHFSFPIHVVIADKKGSKVAGKKPSMKLSREQEAVAEKIRGLGWSEARIKAYLKKDENPNAYYYRFNDIDEPQATGNWNDEEKAMFFELITSQPIDYEWGTFSRSIPGRVGYQCSNFYRSLILKGDIVDPNYFIDDKGKLRFLFKTVSERGSRDDDEAVLGQVGDDSEITPSGPKPARRSPDSRPRAPKRLYRRDRDDLDEKDSGDEMASLEYLESTVADYAPKILPGFIDPITSREVVLPAISPQGYVMGYNTWLKILAKKPENTCPFTRMKVSRRDLVKLTAENLEQYKDKIVNNNVGFGSGTPTTTP